MSLGIDFVPSEFRSLEVGVRDARSSAVDDADSYDVRDNP